MAVIGLTRTEFEATISWAVKATVPSWCPSHWAPVTVSTLFHISGLCTVQHWKINMLCVNWTDDWSQVQSISLQIKIKLIMKPVEPAGSPDLPAHCSLRDPLWHNQSTKQIPQANQWTQRLKFDGSNFKVSFVFGFEPTHCCHLPVVVWAEVWSHISALQVDVLSQRTIFSTEHSNNQREEEQQTEGGTRRKVRMKLDRTPNSPNFRLETFDLYLYSCSMVQFLLEPKNKSIVSSRNYSPKKNINISLFLHLINYILNVRARPR